MLRAIHVFAAIVAYIMFKFGYKDYQTHTSGAIVITGASTGIGRHAAEYIAQQHPEFHVFAGVRKEKDALSIAAMNVTNLQPLLLDVTSHDSCVHAMATVTSFLEEENMQLIALVNNAGVSRKSPLEFQPLTDIRHMFDTNFFGTVDLTQLAIPLLRESRGRIVMISSVAGFFARPTSSVYSATKFAMEGISDGLRRELAHFGISVSVVQPAFVKSNIYQNSVAATESVHADVDQGLMYSLYERFLNAEKKDEHKRNLELGSDTVVTSQAIHHAITSVNPKARYVVAVVGKIPAIAVSWLIWALPDRLEDALFDRM